MDALQRLAPPAQPEHLSLDPHGTKRPAGEDLADGSAMKQQKLDLSDYEIEIEIESSESKPTETDIDISQSADPTILEPDIDMNGENEESSDSGESDVGEQVDELEHILCGRYKLVSLDDEDDYPPADGIANTIEVAPNYEHNGFHFYFTIGEQKRVFSITNKRPQPGTAPVLLEMDIYIDQHGNRGYIPEVERRFYYDTISEVEFPEAGKIRGTVCMDMQIFGFTGERMGDLADWDEYKVWANKRKGDGEYLDGDSTAGDSGSSNGSNERQSETLSEAIDGNFNISSTPHRLRELHMATLPWYRRIYIEDEEGYRWLRDHPEGDESDDYDEHAEMLACVDLSDYHYERFCAYSDDGCWSDDDQDD